jgi:hypothetical protein
VSQEDRNKETKSSVGNKIAIGTVVLALIGLLTAFFNNGGIQVIRDLLANQPTSTPPSPPILDPTPTVSTSTPIQTTLPEPSSTSQEQTFTSTPTSSPIPSLLEGKYSLAWAAQPETQCLYSGSIADLTISSDGFMQGHLANNSPNHIFSGKVNSDGTWSATLIGGYEFNGTLENGVLSGKYTVPRGTAQCQGTVRGFKQPS